MKQSYEWKLADGNVLRWTVESVQARDASGRTMQQTVTGCQLDTNGQQHLSVSTTVYDPKARTTLTWNTGLPASRVASQYREPEAVRNLHSPTPPEPAPDPNAPRPAPSKVKVTEEGLGTRTIAGVEATGQRQSQVTPPGVAGNELPLTMVREWWTAKAPNGETITLSGSTDDPRWGHSAAEVESLTWGPPDPALFVPPADYLVYDLHPSKTEAAKP